MALAYLRSSPAARLVVEVDWVQGCEPASSALDHLSSVLSAVASKPGGISVERGHVIQSSGSTFGVRDLAALERRERRSYSSGSVATMWIVYVDGSFTGSDSVLGLAWSASSIAIFLDQIDTATTALINARAIERSVVTHEVGHLLALVNFGYQSRLDHEDATHPHHSKNDRSVMYWAVDDLALKNLLAGGPPDALDSADLADLRMLRDEA